MAYTDFSLRDLQIKFGIQNKVISLFEKFAPLSPSEWLNNTLTNALQLPNRSEKAKSEAIVFPILLELRMRNKNFITFYSGDVLIADEKNGLKGECDFIVTKDVGTFNLNCPILQVVEAKKNDLEIGVPQCAAQMLGAKIFNEKHHTPTEYVYGCVTTGDEWLFMRLGQTLKIDKRKYYLNELGELLAVFQYIIDEFKSKNELILPLEH